MSSTASAAAAQPKPLVNRFPRCFFEITIEGLYAGIIVFELYDELCPKTVENFRVLCTGEKGVGPTGKSLCYKGTEIHRVVPHFIIQGGDVLRQGGKGTYSIYDRYFDDENFSLNHACPGRLAMAQSEPDKNGSQFYITLVRCEHLDGKGVVFGQVVEGMDVLATIEALGTASGVPEKKIVIADCGEILYDDNAQTA